MKGSLIGLTLSLAIGLGVSFIVPSTEPVVTCLKSDAKTVDQEYVRQNRGFPLHSMSRPLDVPACEKYRGPSCATEYCDNYPGLKEAGGINLVPLAINMAVWSLAAGGVLYMISALFIRV